MRQAVYRGETICDGGQRERGFAAIQVVQNWYEGLLESGPAPRHATAVAAVRA